MKNKKNILIALLGVLAVNLTAINLHAADTFVIAHNGKTDCTIVVSKNASNRTCAAAKDLADYLQKITGATFRIENTKSNHSIVVGTENDFSNFPFKLKFQNKLFTKDSYQLYTDAKALYIIGQTDYGVQNGVWDTLYRIGYRQYFPGKHWEVIPHRKNVVLKLDDYEKPDYIVRNLWYNWGAVDRAALDDWIRKNRMVQSFKLNNGHNYYYLMRSEEFKKHPEWMAMQKNGKRGGNKLCLSNLQLRKYCAKYAIAWLKKHPDQDSISMEASDGGGECQCEKCRKTGNPSDRQVLLANEVADAINQAGIGEKYVGILAYNYHCMPPEHLRPNDHVIVSCANGYSRGGWSFDRICKGWHEKGAIMGTYLYYNVVVRDWCKPGRHRPRDHAAALRKYYEEYGIRFATMEAGESWGPYGLGYYTSSRTLWDTSIGGKYDKVNTSEIVDNSRVMAIIQEFLTKCFGPAYSPMKDFYYKMLSINNKNAYIDGNYITYKQYQDLAEARKLAKGHPDIIARIDDLIKYMNYYTLLTHGTRNELLKWTFRIRKSKMVHALAIFSRLYKTTYSFDKYEKLSYLPAPKVDDIKIDGNDDEDDLLDELGEDNGKKVKMKKHPIFDSTPVTEAELLRILKERLHFYKEKQKNVLLPIKKTFSTDLLPVRKYLKTPKHFAMGKLPLSGEDSGEKRILVYIASKPPVLKFSATITKPETQADLQFLLRKKDPAGDVVARKRFKKGEAGSKGTLTVQLKAPNPGLYCLEATMGNGRVELSFPKNQSFAYCDAPGRGEYEYSQHVMFHGKWTMYFYVPRGTKTVSMYCSKIWSFTGPASGKLLDAAGKDLVDFGKSPAARGGVINVKVPPGQDGKFWLFKDCTALRYLFNVPPYLSNNPENLLLPKEVIQKDFRPNH